MQRPVSISRLRQIIKMAKADGVTYLDTGDVKLALGVVPVSSKPSEVEGIELTAEGEEVARTLGIPPELVAEEFRVHPTGRRH
jgi:hypothetical protein